MPSNMSRDESPSSTTLASFILGLSHQIPPSKLSTMHNESIQRLFLERSTEALPMGSKIRNSVGSNFEEALRLLQLEIEKRVKENERPAAAESADVATNDKSQKKKGIKSSDKYALMAFSGASCHYSTDKRLKLCSDYASSTDFLPEKNENLLQSYKYALLYNRNNGQTTFVDHNAFICAFIEQLKSDASDDATTSLEKTERIIREFVSCLVLSKVPASAASNVGELAARYAAVCFGLSNGHEQMSSVNNVISTILLSISPESIASFVAGYTKCAMGKVSDEPRNKDVQRIFVSMAVALSRTVIQCTALQKLHVPAIEKSLTRFNDAKACMTKLMNWATDHLPHYSTEESNSGNKSGGDTDEEDIAHDSEHADESEEEELGVSLRRSTRKRKEFQ
eukprot:scaffold1460_cov138-Skeletonema_menzelii.AAC.2